MDIQKVMFCKGVFSAGRYRNAGSIILLLFYNLFSVSQLFFICTSICGNGMFRFSSAKVL